MNITSIFFKSLWQQLIHYASSKQGITPFFEVNSRNVGSRVVQITELENGAEKLRGNRS
jgi:hypothetical protein